MSASPFHPGEQLVQARVGVRERMDARGARAIRDAMPDEHRAFFALLTFLPIATESPAGWPIASILTGPAGFVSSPDPRSLHVAAGGVRVGERIGILGIDLRPAGATG